MGEQHETVNKPHPPPKPCAVCAVVGGWSVLCYECSGKAHYWLEVFFSDAWPKYPYLVALVRTDPNIFPYPAQPMLLEDTEWDHRRVCAAEVSPYCTSCLSPIDTTHLYSFYDEIKKFELPPLLCTTCSNSVNRLT